MNHYFHEQIPPGLLRHTLFIMGFCFLPFVNITPWWLTMLAIGVISYRVTANVYHRFLLPKWLHILLVFGVIALLRWYYGSFFSSGFFIGFLMAFFWLKVIEIHRMRDLRMVALACFYVIFTALIIHISLWILLYMILALLAVLSLLLKFERPSASTIQLSRQSASFVLLAIPASTILFFLFPRLTDPLWQVHLPMYGKTGFKENLSPGAISSLFPDDHTVMRVTFKKPMSSFNIYWYGLILNHYNGITWTSQPQAYNDFLPLAHLPSKQEGEYEILLEPHQKLWMFYMREPAAGWPRLRFSPSYGLTSLKEETINQRMTYALTTQNPHYRPLNPKSMQRYLQLPSQGNPKLRAWAIKEKLGKDPSQFISQILKYIHHEPFWYTLNPKLINTSTHSLDEFWFNTREGYCEHYASSVAFILRAAGIPARVVIGYYGGEWNPLGQYLKVRQKDAHAWLEYWQEGLGWQRLDPTTAIAPQRIDERILQENDTLSTALDWNYYRFKLSWLETIRLRLETMQFFWERWLLFYNQEQQQSLLQTLGLGHWDWGRLLQLWTASFLLFLFLGSMWLYWQKRIQDPLLKEYHRLQHELQRLNIKTTPPATLRQQWQALAHQKPQWRSMIEDHLRRYETLRLQSSDNNSPACRKALQTLFKSLRKTIKKL
ncbi:transglutaminaseTgpA domain-containing protein [Legionella oakridgensis]|uniref:Transglutaminase n=2 Tax=Legionella oakridgensis TaxID=29423 RepID=A0A0W0XJA4_9GAMM|nr:DUF3488 and transglutaminase-like domain-containing protein [Legionella oakridgensis]AHE68035.1 transglutaminase-like enzyme, putative cysteine protease [Legionella oakridgensis ATCC 33761 = DSM 21215]ETO92463.1 transglutaminase-like enzyme, putative cysteine protease [Legionella oakridgensis RV-2-2007]KTD44565.1 transglutaminase [Legionella oakridgensis]STY21024.1 transglutaminase domain-containing protein [Legionella longbeachae]